MPRAARPNASFRQSLSAAVESAVARLRAEIGGERLYAFALYTSGEEGFSYVCATANTEEGLTRAAAAYATTSSEYAGEAGRALLRWSAPDWAWHDFSPEVAAVELPPGEGAARDRRVLRDFVSVLSGLDERGVFGEGDARPTLAILCGDISEAFRRRSLEALNPRAVFEKYLEECTPERYLEELASLPVRRRLETAIELYRELALDLRTPRALEAKQRHVTQEDVATVLAGVGPAASARLLDLAEAHGLGPTFHEKGSEAWTKYGAFTLAEQLATSAALLAGRAGLSDEDVTRAQRLIARRVEIDRDVRGPTSLLAACLARVLRSARPNRFPVAVQSDTTNHLENAEAFLARSRRWWRPW